MAANPLERCIKSAVRANTYQSALFGKIGSADHPNGAVLVAYRNANRAIKAALREENIIAAVREVLLQLKRTVRAEAVDVLIGSDLFGLSEAERQLEYYNKPNSYRITADVNPAVQSIVSEVDKQQTMIEGMIYNGLDPVLITGDEEHQGALRFGPVAVASAFWISTTVWSAFSKHVERNAPTFDKQAVAALDLRTTDCCLRVHGQIQHFEEMFKLTGSPRFADELKWGPFHYHCRTSVVLYDKIFDDGLTDRMEESADYVRAKRKSGEQFDQHPADAFVSIP